QTCALPISHHNVAAAAVLRAQQYTVHPALYRKRLGKNIVIGALCNSSTPVHGPLPRKIDHVGRRRAPAALFILYFHLDKHHIVAISKNPVFTVHKIGRASCRKGTRAWWATEADETTHSVTPDSTVVTGVL